jgi:hypothetical protein
MRLGLLGWDDTIRSVAQAAIAGGDRIALAAVPRPDDAAGLPGAPAWCHWERLLDAAETDAILVAAADWDDQRAEAVKTLVQIARPLLLAFPPTLSMLWAFEIEMIRADAGGPIIPFLPDRLHPFIKRMRAELEGCLAGTSPLGIADAITIERPLADHSREAVLQAFARDADLLRVIAGEPTRLATIGGRHAGGLAGLTVECGGADGIPSRWQATRPSGAEPSARLSLVAERGTIAIEIPPVTAGTPDEARAVWEFEGAGRSERAPFAPAAEMLEVLRDAVEGSMPAGCDSCPSRSPLPAATWPEAARLVELAETVPRSLARARAIDLHQEEFSEIGTFKGTMASLGCGLVLAALVILVLATLMAGIAREAGWALGERLASAWPIIVLVVLAAFLMLQLLPLLIGPSRRPGQHETSPPGKGPRSPGGG